MATPSEERQDTNPCREFSKGHRFQWLGTRTTPSQSNSISRCQYQHCIGRRSRKAVKGSTTSLCQTIPHDLALHRQQSGLPHKHFILILFCQVRLLVGTYLISPAQVMIIIHARNSLLVLTFSMFARLSATLVLSRFCQTCKCIQFHTRNIRMWRIERQDQSSFSVPIDANRTVTRAVNQNTQVGSGSLQQIMSIVIDEGSQELTSAIIMPRSSSSQRCCLLSFRRGISLIHRQKHEEVESCSM